MSMLALQNVSYKYEKSTKTIFKDVNISFEAGKVYIIVGKSGMGKSTLLSLLAGLDVATSGQITYNGENLAKSTVTVIEQGKQELSSKDLIC